ncbi:hypothetical protein FC093_20010 [Ilyomonas limi]|uniref:Ig-like domain-containing protein n=1 Tax=Ilyomonas limi TaxID=2575867 RepID=A0A4U3KWH4_9BACT|nr:hypothetical protein [Ilyomonas limi]TKK65397.1 hypothetical protein FC093_20010 [Ilyomonas limi]
MKTWIYSIAVILLLVSCAKKDEGYCPATLKLTASNTKPTVGDNLTIFAHDGALIYNWSGPHNYAEQKEDGTDVIKFTNIAINQSGWYYCRVSAPGCNALSDSIYIDVQYQQGTPSCSLVDNTIDGDGLPTLQALGVTKEYSTVWNCMSMYASGSFGYPTYTFLFNSYNGQVEPKDGIYKTVNVPVFNDQQDANAIYLQCQYGGYFFKSKAGQDVYVSHVNGKLRIAFCDVDFAGDNGNGTILNAAFSGQVTEK